MNGKGERYTFLYDAAGQKTVQVDPLLRRTTSIYDAAGNETGRIDAKSDRTTYTFNAVSELTGRRYPDSSRATYAYDSRGNEILKENAVTVSTMVYDALNRTKSVTTDMGNKKTISYEYDAADNRSLMIDPDGGRFTYSYDANGQITSLRNPQNDRTSFVYDANGQRTVKRLTNGTRASMSYDALGNKTNVTNLKSNGTTISSFDYKFDADNNQTSITEADSSIVTYSYDAASQFIGEHRTGTNSYRNTYTYDAAQNRTLKNEDSTRTTYTYDAANQLVTSLDPTGTTTYTYDKNGNQELVVTPTGDRTTTTWDYENRTTSILLPSSIRNTMSYEPDGLRVELQESTDTKRFIYDHQAYLAETDTSDSVNVLYTQEPTLYGNLISQYRKDGSIWTPSYYHQDALGSTRELSDSSESVTDTYLYNAWGELLSTTGSTKNNFQWTGNIGYYFDLESDTYYIRARTYEPTIGRWLSVDPLGVMAGDNLYINTFSPFNIDPSGLYAQRDLEDIENWTPQDWRNWRRDLEIERRGPNRRILDKATCMKIDSFIVTRARRKSVPDHLLCNNELGYQFVPLGRSAGWCVKCAGCCEFQHSVCIPEFREAPPAARPRDIIKHRLAGPQCRCRNFFQLQPPKPKLPEIA